jgi:ankyrin repeat protein
VLDAGILPPLLKLLESQDSACREDATWVLYNISSNHDMRQISYLAEQSGIRALCNLLNCSKELDVLWKGCGTVAAVALKGLRNILVAGQQDASNDPNGYNSMAALVAEAHGVERIEALTSHVSADVRQRARLLLERFFGAEPAPSSADVAGVPDDHTNAANAAAAAAASAAAAAVVSPGASLSHVTASHFPDPGVAAAAAAAIADPAGFAAAAAAAAAAASTTTTCSCPHPHPTMYADHSAHLLTPLPSASPSTSDHDATRAAAAAAAAHYHATAVVAAAAAATGFHSHSYAAGLTDSTLPPAGNGLHPATVPARVLPAPADGNTPSSAVSSPGSSTESDPEDDDSDSDLLPPPPAPCSCVLCSDTTPLSDRRPKKVSAEAQGGSSGSASTKGNASEGKAGDGSLSPGSGSTQPGELDGQVDRTAPQDKDAPLGEFRGDSGDAAVGESTRTLCEFCSGGGRLGDGKAGMAAKLGRAVRLGHSHCVAILLSRMTWSQRVAATEAPALLHPGGGPPDGGVSSSLPAVALAAHLGKPECLALLLRRCRPDLDVTHGKKRLTALAWAAHKGYYKCCELLLQHGARAGAKCGECLTALHLASSGGGQLSICELLLKHNAPVNAKSTKDQTPLCLATQKGYSRLVRLLLEHNADCNNEDEGRFTPLHIAASNGFGSSAEELIRHGAKIDCKTRTGVTPLHYAVQGGHANVVKLLVSAGAKVNCTRKPLLIIAADDGNRQVVQILLDALAAIDCTANIKATLEKDMEVHDKLTPLHLSSSKGHKDVVELLLRRGASVDARTEKGGWTALDFAVLNGHPACAIALLEHGATVTDNARKVGNSGSSLVQHAARNGNKTVVKLLVQRLQEQKALAPISMGGRNPNAVPLNSSFAVLGPATRAVFAPSPAPPSPLSLSGSQDPTRMNGSLFDGEEIDVALQPDFEPLGGLIHHTHDGTCNHAHHRYGDEIESGDLHSHPHAHHQHHRDLAPPSVSATSSSSNKYDPRSSVGDESGFGSGPGYGNGPVTACNPYAFDGPAEGAGSSTAATSGRAPVSSGSRRRAAKDDHVMANRQRERESKRRETEATEARQRLEEAISQQSIRKLSEAIDHVSKLVLQLGANVAADPVPPPGGIASGAQPLPGLDDSYSAFAGEGGIDLTGSGGAAVAGATAGGGNPVGNTSQGTSASHIAALQVEAGLGLEVQKARKILASLQAEERRVKEERAREAAEAKKDANQQLVQKAIDLVLEGSDVRTLNRTVSRARRAILEADDPIVLEASELSALVVAAGAAYCDLQNAMRNRGIDLLLEAVEDVRQTSAALARKNGKAAAVRANGGEDPAVVVTKAEEMLDALVKERDSAKAEQAAAEAQEDAAIEALKQALESGKLCDIETCLEKAVADLLSKDSSAAALIELAKKSFAKSLKGERRKLRQANSSNEGSKIDAAVAAAKSLKVSALMGDIEASVELSAKLREQETRRSDLNAAISAGDANSIAEIRGQLQSLGMFTEAEAARAELDNLQKASRARSLLSAALRDAQEATEGLQRKSDGVDMVVDWVWPDGQKLFDLVKRTKGKFGGSLDNLCSDTEQAALDLSATGRGAVASAISYGDTRVLAGAIAAYEKAFMNVDSRVMFDAAAGQECMADARSRLAALQAKEQEKVKAEAAQVKTEYALATSRRTTIRQRGTRRGRGLVSATVVAPSLKSGSVASTNSSDDDETLDADITMASEAADGGNRNFSWHGRTNGGVADACNGFVVYDGECSHYYLWKSGTTVQCARCSNVRESVNGEWLQRVKKRGNKAPSDVTALAVPGTGAPTGMNGVPTTATPSATRSGSSLPQSAMQPVMMGGGTVGGAKSRPSAAPVGALPCQAVGGERVGNYPSMMGGRVAPPHLSLATIHQQMHHRQQMQERKQQEHIGRMLRSQAQPGISGVPPQGARYASTGGYPMPVMQLPQAASQQRAPVSQSQTLGGLMQSIPGGAEQGRILTGDMANTGAPRGMQVDVSAPGGGRRRGPAGGQSTGVGSRDGMNGQPGGSSAAMPTDGLRQSQHSHIPHQQPRGEHAQRSRHMSELAAHPQHSQHAQHAQHPHSRQHQPHAQAVDESGVDLGMDFANENFGFDIDSLLGKGGLD